VMSGLGNSEPRISRISRINFFICEIRVHPWL
jgi:hypothetical protein